MITALLSSDVAYQSQVSSTLTDSESARDVVAQLDLICLAVLSLAPWHRRGCEAVLPSSLGSPSILGAAPESEFLMYFKFINSWYLGKHDVTSEPESRSYWQAEAGFSNLPVKGGGLPHPGYASLDILSQHILGYLNLRNLYRAGISRDFNNHDC